MQIPKRKGVAFTSNYERIVNACYMQVDISPIDNTSKTIKVYGVWDTGATSSAIHTKHVQALNLPTTTMCRVNTASGTVNATKHLINMKLPNGNVLTVQVTATDLVDTDMLIGMDIISQGDFAISNYNGKTIVNFRMPSFADINFVDMANSTSPINKPNKVQRNNPCPCGSTRKYKNCCGR